MKAVKRNDRSGLLLQWILIEFSVITVCRIGADMTNYRGFGQLDLSERLAIEVGLSRGESFKRIAKTIRRHPSTVSHEVLANRTFIHGYYYAGKDCQRAKQCVRRGLCAYAQEEECRRQCKFCDRMDCRDLCRQYVSLTCRKTGSPPYVCNNCKDRKFCMKDRYVYTAVYANEASAKRRSESRQGIRLTEKQKEEVVGFLLPLIRKGQPLAHIYAEHEAELPMSLRSLYNYIDDGALNIKSIDLRRKVRYKRRKKSDGKAGKLPEYRKGRTYTDYRKFIEDDPDTGLEMDTVLGKRTAGKRILTMIFRENSVMLMFLMPDGKAESVRRVFDFLEGELGTECFKRLFPVCLADNGSEFKQVEGLERTKSGALRTHIFYCDPMASWQKPHVEKNHEYIRYVLPKGVSFDPLTREDVTLLMNHINSTKRPSLGNKAPYELISDKDEDMKALFSLLKMDLIPSDEVHLMPDLFKRNR